MTEKVIPNVIPKAKKPLFSGLVFLQLIDLFGRDSKI
jgi:hypothetical protein